MKLLLIGDANSIHLYNYVYYMNKNYPEISISIFNSRGLIEERSIPYFDYYEFKGIRVVSSELHTFTKKSSRLPVLRKFNYFIKGIKKINKMGKFDICHVHAVTKYSSIVTFFCKSNFRKIISTFWGSDLYRLPKSHRKYQKLLLNQSEYVTFATPAMAKTFNEFFDHKFENKIVMKLLGIHAFDELIRLTKNIEKETYRRELKLPDNRFIVVCGYNGAPAQQHIRLINELSKTVNEKEKFYFVFPSGYNGTEEYIDEVIAELSNSGLKGKVIKEYLSSTEMAMLALTTDIFIHVQVSDALSAAMLEQLYANSIVINGAWLDYSILDEKDIWYIKAKNIEEVPGLVVNIANNFEDYKNRTKQNTEKLYSLFSWDNSVNEWVSLYKEVMKS